MRRVGRLLVPGWVDRNFGIILAARAAMSVGRALASVVTALYLADIGFSGLEIGALFVGVTIASALMATTIGLASDLIGRKVFLVVVPLMTAAAGLVFTGSRAAPALFVAAALGSFGRGSGAGAGNVGPYQPAEAAFVAESAPGRHRPAAFGRIAFASSAGALVGGLLAELVHTTSRMTPAQATAAYRPAFIAASACAVVAGVMALLLDEPPRRTPTGSQRRRIRWPARSWPALWRFWCTNSVNGLAVGLSGPFVSYWLYRRYGASPGAIGVLFAVVNVGSLASSLAAAPAGRHLGTVRAIAAVRLLGGALLLPMVLAPSFWLAGAIYLVRMVVQRVGMPLRQSFTQDMAHPEERSSVAALSNLPAQATMADSQALAGYLFDEISLASPFELAAIFQCANALLYVWLFSWRPPRGAPDDHAPTTAGAVAPQPSARAS
ncbi:MAG: MFS transporter [Acidobacteriota bacterium]|nr:MFS transporter [Acidobacteriota bacterium]